MSGHKRSTISLSDLDLSRLENIEEKLRNVENDYESIHKRVKEKLAKEQQNNLADMVIQERSFQETVANAIGGIQEDLTRELSDIEEEYMSNTKNQAETLQNELLNLRSEIWDQSLVLIGNYQYQSEINLQKEIDKFQSFLSQVVCDFSSDQQKKFELSIGTLNAAQLLLDHLEQHIPVEQYYPGLTISLKEELNQGWNNLDNGMIEAGYLVGQQLLIRIKNLQQEISHREYIRKSLLTLVSRKADEVFEIGKKQGAVKAIDLDGNELGIEIDVPFWSNGRYAKAMRKAQAFKHQIEKNGDSLQVDDLKTLLSDKLVKVEEEISNAVYQARRNVLASQVRFNIAGSVIHALMEQGFILSGGRYCNSDQRGSYQALLRHIDGSEVVILVSELTGEVGSSQIDLETINASRYSEHELKQRAKEMAISLSNYGLHIGKTPYSASKILPQELPGYLNNQPKMVKENQVQYGRN